MARHELDRYPVDGDVVGRDLMGRRLVEEQGAEALVLGCGSATGLAARVSQDLNIPVLDPGLTAVKYAEMLVDLGLSQSKRAYPHNPRVAQLLTDMMATER